MLDLFKKRDAIVNKGNLFRDLHSFVTDSREMDKEDILEKQMPVIKSTLGKLFFMENSYTFEELVTKVENFEEECNKHFKELEELNKKKKKFLEENKNKKKDKKFFIDLRKKNKDIEEANKRYNTSKEVLIILEDKEIKEKIKDFSEHASKMQFSKRKFSRKDIDKAIYDFLWIVNRMSIKNHKKEKITLDRKKSNKEEILSDQENIIDTELDKLIMMSEKALSEEDFFTADEIYRQLLRRYKISRPDIKKDLYEKMFSLWFKLYSHKR